jgi:lipid II:glycine glycyltransferase (peptidoglycan interpeptide bridge formation enzyme)
LRKAHASRLEVREVDPVEQLPTFMGLYGDMSTRKQFVDRHHVEQLPEFIKAAPRSLRIRMFLANADGAIVAGTIIAGSGDLVFAPFSASNQEALPLRAGFALRWAIINELRGSREKWLDLGGDEGDTGLRHFKEGNVGSRGRIVSIPGEFDYAESALSSAATAAIGWAHGLSRGRSLQSLRAD